MVMHHNYMAPLMVLHVHAKPTREAAQWLHANQRFERFHQLQQAHDAKLPPVVDHLVVSASVTTFVSYVIDTFSGVRVSAESMDAVESIDVRVDRDTGLEILSKSGRISSKILVEVLMPSPQSVRVLEARRSGTIVLESVLTNDPHADVRIHLVGDCEVFVSSRMAINVASISLEPQGGGFIQLIAPELVLMESLQARVASLGSVRVFTGKLAGPIVQLDTAGYGSIQVAALELDGFSKVAASSIGKAKVMTIGDTFRATHVAASTSGEGKISILAFKELLINSVDCSADGGSEIAIASHYGHSERSRLSVAGKSTVDARDVVARDADIHAAGAGTIYFRSSDIANVQTNGCHRDHRRRAATARDRPTHHDPNARIRG